MAGVKGNGSRPREKPHLIADELRALIAAGELGDGESLGREPELVERFGVSRPSLREALRILEAEGLVTVVRGVRGGVVVHRPHERIAARSAALVLQANEVPLADVFDAGVMLEPLAAKAIAQMGERDRRAAVDALRPLVARQWEAVGDAERFRRANAAFHERLVSLVGNQTLGVVSEMLTEIVTRAVTAVREGGYSLGTPAGRRRTVRSQERLLELLEEGDGEAAEKHWRAHMKAMKRALLGSEATAVVDLADHY